MGALFSGEGRVESTSVKSNKSTRKDQIRKYTSDLKSKSDDKINKMIEESMTRIKLQQKESENQVKQATLEAVKSIVSKYIENVPSDDEISKKLS